MVSEMPTKKILSKGSAASADTAGKAKRKRTAEDERAEERRSEDESDARDSDHKLSSSGGSERGL